MEIVYGINVTNTTTTTLYNTTTSTIPYQGPAIRYSGECWRWVAPKGWEEISTIGNCTFKPYKMSNLNDTYTKMTCKFPWNMSTGSGFTDVMREILKFSDLNQITENREKIGELKTELTAWRVTTILLFIILVGFIVWEYVMIYEEE